MIGAKDNAAWMMEPSEVLLGGFIFAIYKKVFAKSNYSS